MRSYIRLLVVLSVAFVMGPTYAQEPSQPARDGGKVTLDYEVFKSKVQPILAAKRQGMTRCVVCHSKFPPTGFHMERPGPEGKWTEEQSRQNFQQVSRRVVPGVPEKSRLLLHPLRFEAGGTPFHFGGKHWNSPNEPEWQVINAWVLGKTPTS